jgi:hypothetical protein
MIMTPKTRKRWLMTMGGFLAIAASLFHYKERNSYRCQSCWARKDVFQWRLGSWPGASIPLAPRWERVFDTHFQHDLLPAGHTHDWKFAQGSPYYFFGTSWGGCALGRGWNFSILSQIYESSSEFRAFVAQELGDGTLTKSNFVAMMSCPQGGEPSPIQKEADALLEKFFGR